MKCNVEDLTRRRRLAVLFGIALALRLLVVLASGPSRSDFGDAAAYIRTSRALLDTHAYPADVDPLPVFRAPGYPVFLAISTMGHPEALAIDKVWNALLGALTVPLLALLAGAAFRSERAATLSGAIAAVHPSFLVLAKDVQSEALFVLFFVAAALLLLAAWDTSRVALAFAAGASLGFAILTRPSALLLLVLVPLLLAARRTPFTSRLVCAAVLACVAVVVPWTVRNRLAYREWIPVSDQLGFALYLGNSELNERYYQLRSRGDYESWSDEVNADVERGRIRMLAGPPGTNPGTRSRALTNAALVWIHEHPRRTIRLLLHKAADWARPWPSPFGWPAAVVIAVGTYNSLLYVAAALGLWAAPRRGIAAAAVLVLLGTMAAHVALMVTWRYRIVYWDPVIVLFTSYGLVTIFGRGHRGKRTG